LESWRRKKRQCLSVQSIMGATEKRRESGAGVAVIGGIGGSEMGGASRRWGVYQDWGCGA